MEAYTSFTTKSEDFDSTSSLRVERLSDSWPMARLAITLDGLAAQLSKIVMTATMKITASCRYSNSCLPCLIQLAKDVTYCIGASPCRPRSQLAMWHLRSASSTSLQAQRACYRLHIGFARFTRSYYTPHRIRLSFGTQYLWCCLFYSLVVKDCQYPRDPMQPAIKKKNYTPHRIHTKARRWKRNGPAMGWSK